MLGRRLNLPESLLRNIDIENHRVVEKGVEMFTVWKERKGNDASVASLRKGLEKIGRRDLSEKVRGTLDMFDYSYFEKGQCICFSVLHKVLLLWLFSGDSFLFCQYKM